LPNLRDLAREAGVLRMDRHCIELAGALCCFLNHFALNGATEQMARWGLSSAEHLSDKECEGFFLTKLGAALNSLGDGEEAIRVHQRALDIRRRLGEPRYLAGNLANLGMVFQDMGLFDHAIEMRSEAVSVAASSGNSGLEATVRMMLAYSLMSVGRIDGA